MYGRKFKSLNHYNNWAKRKRYVKRKPKGISYKTAKKVAKREVKNDKEVKHTQYESVQVATDSSTTPASYVFWPAQGVESYGNIEQEGLTQGQRIGNAIYLKSIISNFQITLGSGVTTDSENVVRLTIFQWMDDIALHYPTFGDVFCNAPTGYPYLATFNPDSKGKYKILFDKTYTLSQNAGNPFTIIRKINIKNFKRRKIIFDQNGTSGYNAAIYRGGIFWLLTSDSSIAPHPTITWSSRMNYTD